MKPKTKNRWMLALRLLPMFLMILGMYYYNKQYGLFKVENIFDFTPTNLWIAALFFLVMYAMKPITLIIPLWALQVSCAMFFSPTEALIINTVGVALSLVIAYFLGFYLGKNRVQDMYEKLKKKKSMDDLTEDSQFFYVFIIRIIGIISMDVTGMVMGSMKINFIKYFIASMLGLMPAVVIGTFIGTSLSDPTSPSFIVSLILKGMLVVLSIWFYRKRYKNKATSL